MKETGFENFQSEIEELLIDIDKTTTPKKRKNDDQIDSGKKHKEN